MKEYYFYLDATPTSSYLHYRYQYPLAAYPYEDLLATNRTRGRERRSLIVVNLADAPVSAQVHRPWADLHGAVGRLAALLTGERYERDGDETARAGLFVQLPPWGGPVLAWSRSGSTVTLQG